MDAYLKIAREILLQERRPLGAKAILIAAYRRGLVPARLYGKTQHKTLQARISEEIIAKRDRSIFFRPQSGKFFLREFLDDTTLPEEYRQPLATRRRMRELLRGPALALNAAALRGVAHLDQCIEPSNVFRLLKEEAFTYSDPKICNSENVFVWSFVCVRREHEILSYRVGQYRDNRDSFALKRSIGFSTLVKPEDRSLFNYFDFGIIEAGVRAATIDLDIPQTGKSARLDSSGNLSCFIWISERRSVGDLVALIQFHCPSWFEPVKRKLALNDLRWLDTRVPVNNIDDFDPWSKFVLMQTAK